jgi:hypothetical protein
MKTLKDSPKMPIYKPYKLTPDPPPTTEEKPDEQLPMDTLKQPPPSSVMGPMMMPPSTVLPHPPPPMLALYQILPVQMKTKPDSPPASDPPPGQPLTPAPVAESTTPPPPTTKPRVIHEYYDQHSFQWKEFNPEDTVVGDESDPFIVYFRYASKSIGARRTPYILPKHVKLIKIMQDCLPDFDWRAGEDLLVSSLIGLA